MSGVVGIVRTGVANLASVVAAVERLGACIEWVDDGEAVLACERLVLPGVGAFDAAMDALERRGLVEPLRERLASGAPLLAICLGMQLCCEGSEEAPGRGGLGAVPGQVRRLPDGVRVPQLGWNRIEPDPACALVAAGHVVYANSYALPAPAPGRSIGDWKVARSTHGMDLVAALERGAQLLCQFHPELSGAVGSALLERWLLASEIPAAAGGASC